VMKGFIRIGERERFQEGMGPLYTLKISLLVVFLFILGCTGLPEDKRWDTAENVRVQTYKLQVGDIIVKNKKPNPLSWYGHAAIMVDEDTIGDYPKIGIGYYEIDPYSWLYENRKVVVLRYKNFDERFKKKLLKNIEASKGKGYWVGLNKENDKRFYCSQFLWYLYWKTAKDLGYELDLDSDGGPLVFPYDFLRSEDLYQVPFETRQED